MSSETEIRPFRIEVPDEELAELRRRIAATRWPEKELVDDQSQGVQSAMMRALARYWAADHDWRKVEAELNALPQFKTEIDGLGIHFIHVRSPHENARATRVISMREPSASSPIRADRPLYRANAREAFSHVSHKLKWDTLDALYFAGYALWNYVSTPFMLARRGFQLREGEPWREGGETWRRLEAIFPSDIPTHSREQTFFFDERGLLRRLDYTAEVFSRWARASNYCYDYREMSGVMVPTRHTTRPWRSPPVLAHDGLDRDPGL